MDVLEPEREGRLLSSAGVGPRGRTRSPDAEHNQREAERQGQNASRSYRSDAEHAIPQEAGGRGPGQETGLAFSGRFVQAVVVNFKDSGLPGAEQA